MHLILIQIQCHTPNSSIVLSKIKLVPAQEKKTDAAIDVICAHKLRDWSLLHRVQIVLQESQDPNVRNLSAGSLHKFDVHLEQTKQIKQTAQQVQTHIAIPHNDNLTTADGGTTITGTTVSSDSIDRNGTTTLKDARKIYDQYSQANAKILQRKQEEEQLYQEIQRKEDENIDNKRFPMANFDVSKVDDIRTLESLSSTTASDAIRSGEATVTATTTIDTSITGSGGTWIIYFIKSCTSSKRI